MSWPEEDCRDGRAQGNRTHMGVKKRDVPLKTPLCEYKGICELRKSTQLKVGTLSTTGNIPLLTDLCVCV